MAIWIWIMEMFLSKCLKTWLIVYEEIHSQNVKSYTSLHFTFEWFILFGLCYRILLMLPQKKYDHFLHYNTSFIL